MEPSIFLDAYGSTDVQIIPHSITKNIITLHEYDYDYDGSNFTSVLKLTNEKYNTSP